MIKGPFIVIYPNKVPANYNNNYTQSLVDIGTTFLNLLSGKVSRTMTELNQLPVWFGEKTMIRDNIICESRQSETTVH